MLTRVKRKVKKAKVKVGVAVVVGACALLY